MDRLSKLKQYLTENFPDTQMFNSRNLVGDVVTTVYCEDGVTVDYCEAWDYLEIFGLTDEEYNQLTSQLI